MALTRPICRLKCLRFVSLRSLPFSRHVLLLHKEWDVREKGERKDFLPSFLFFRLSQVSRMPLSSKPCASSPAQSRHLRTNGHVGASDCKASFNVLAGRLLQRLCLSSGFRNGFRQTLEAVLTGLPYADKKRYQNLCLSLLRSILDSELRGNVRLIEMLLSAVAALLRSGFKTAVLLDCDAQSLLQAMLENEAQLTRICRTYERSGLTALALLCSFYATVQKERGDTSQSSVFARLLFVRHSFAAFIASASTATLLRTLTSVRVRPQEKSPVRLFLSPEFFAPVFHSHLHSHPLSFVNDLPHTNAPASRERELLQLLSHAGLVGATHRARRWTDDGRLTDEILWELGRATVRRLFSLITSETAMALQDAAYDYLQLESDSQCIIDRSDSAGKTKRASTTMLCHPVINGAVATVGLFSWANAVLVQALARVSKTVKTDHGARRFFVIGFQAQENADTASPSGRLSRTPSATSGFCEEYLSVRKQTLETVTDNPHFLPALPIGLFVPSRFFATPPALWLAPLEALGLAVICTRAPANAVSVEKAEEPSKQSRFKDTYRYESGVLFLFFDSTNTARWWLKRLCKGDFADFKQTSRARLLKHFLLTDVMARLLRILVLQTRQADQSVGHQILGQSAALAETPTGETVRRELKKFLPVQHFRKVCAASFAELAHGFLAHDLQHKGRTDVATGLEAVIEAQKRQLASARSKRLKRIAARPDP